MCADADLGPRRRAGRVGRGRGRARVLLRPEAPPAGSGRVRDRLGLPGGHEGHPDQRHGGPAVPLRGGRRLLGARAGDPHLRRPRGPGRGVARPRADGRRQHLRRPGCLAAHAGGARARPRAGPGGRAVAHRPPARRADRPRVLVRRLVRTGLPLLLRPHGPGPGARAGLRPARGAVRLLARPRPADPAHRRVRAGGPDLLPARDQPRAVGADRTRRDRSGLADR